MEFLIPSSWSLFKPINSLGKTINMVLIISVSNDLRLCRINLLHKMPIEKDIIYIKLSNSLLAINRKTKHCTDGYGIYHRRKSLMKINTWSLVKAFSNKTSLVPFNRSIRISFDAKHPFVSYYILP